MDLSSNNPHFAAGDAAIVFVKSMDREVQRRLGITATDTSVLTVVPCTGFWSETEITAALGAGEAPRKEREKSAVRHFDVAVQRIQRDFGLLHKPRQEGR
jgi:hypothetical protein